MKEKTVDMMLMFFIVVIYLIMIPVLLAPTNKRMEHMEMTIKEQGQIIQEQGELLDSVANIVYD